MFESIVERFGSTYDIKVLSTDPWVVTFENFLDDDEIKTLISSGEHHAHSHTPSYSPTCHQYIYIEIHSFATNQLISLLFNELYVIPLLFSPSFLYFKYS